MGNIPQDLVKSLMQLGLLESEAKIYIALVMMNNSEVKELIDFVGLSKPNTYEGLRSLEEKGLINLINEKPITYQSVSPEIGLEILIDTHLKAKEMAKKLFSTLEMETDPEKLPEKLWYVFTKKNIEYKMRDMVKNAKKSVYILTSDHYAKFLKPLANKDIDLQIAIISGKDDAESKLRNLFKNDKTNLIVVNKDELTRMLAIYKSVNQQEFIPIMQSYLFMLNYNNMLILIVDDTEILYILPLSGDDMNAINSRSKSMIESTKMVYKAMCSYLVKDIQKIKP